MAVAFVQIHGYQEIKAAGTTINALVVSGGVLAGNTIVAAIISDNAATIGKPIVSSIAKMSGETASWVLLGRTSHPSSTTAGAFASGELWAIKTTVAWAAGTYTVTLDTSVTQKSVNLIQFSGVEQTVRSTTGTNYSTTTTAASATTTGTTPVIGDLALGYLFGSNVAAAQAGDTDTTGGSWVASPTAAVGTTGGSAATNNFGRVQWKILTGASHQTYNNSAAMTAGNGSIVAVLQATPDPLVTQAAYRWYDEGTETGATALGNQDTSVVGDVGNGDATGVLRVRLQSTTTNPPVATDDWQLQWEKNTSGSWTNVVPGAASVAAEQLTDNSNEQIGSTGSDTGCGQTFLGDGLRLSRVSFKLSRRSVANNTGPVWAELYAHTGTYGSSGVPTGSVLATSTNTVDSQTGVATTGPTSGTWVDFNFDSTVTLTATTPYVVAVRAANLGSSGNESIFIRASSADAHPGNRAIRSSAGTWSATFNDAVFQVWTTNPTPASTAVGYASPSLTDGAVTTNRLTGGTGSFVAGKISETGLVSNLGWTANNHTELVYALQIRAADVVNGDTLRFRILRNGATTYQTFTQTPTITLSAGPSGTATGTYALAGSGSGERASSGAVTAAYDYAGTATGTRASSGSASAAYDYAGSAAGSAPAAAAEGTATGGYDLAGTSAGSRTSTGTATGTHDYAATTAGSRTSSGASTGAYDYTGATAGSRTSTGTATGTLDYAGSATGTAPAVGAAEGTATGSYTYTATTAGTRTSTGATTGTHDYTGSAAGTVGATATGTHAYAGTATGSRTSTGTTTAAYDYTATTAGSRTSTGATTGTHTYAGTTAGSRASTGTATGGYDHTGSAAGSRASSGTTAGTHDYAGSAAGARSSQGATTAGYTYTGSAAGSVGGTTTASYDYTATTAGTRTSTGATSGAYLFAGTALGGTANGIATGTHTYSGTAAGTRTSTSTATGTHTYAGSATGSAPAVGAATGTATGTHDYTGTATGARTSTGAPAAGTYTYTVTAVGTAPPVGAATGSASGSFELLGLTATGTRDATGTSTGSFTYTATIAGHTTHDGLSVGTVTWTGTAVGNNADLVPPRDLIISVDLGDPTWSADLADEPWAIDLGDETWSATIHAHPAWAASLGRWVWRAHLNYPEDTVYDSDRAIYTPTVTITAATGTDLTSTTFLMRIDEGDWVPPDDAEVDGNIARLKLLVGTDAYPVEAGRAKVFVSVADSPEDFDLFAGSIRVEPAPAV